MYSEGNVRKSLAANSANAGSLKSNKLNSASSEVKLDSSVLVFSTTSSFILPLSISDCNAEDSPIALIELFNTTLGLTLVVVLSISSAADT